MSIVCFFIWIPPSSSQNNPIGCHVILNQVDKLLEESDTISAMRLYEALNEENCVINKRFFWVFGKIYYQIGMIEESKKQVEKAVENGIWGSSYFGYREKKMEKEVEVKYGTEFLQNLLATNDKLIKKTIENNGSLIHELKSIYDDDQTLRRNKKYKKCKGYAYDYRLGLPYDSTQNHREMMVCNQEYSEKDSIVLQRFVNIIDSIGYVPTDDILFGMVPMDPIICHTSHYDFTNLDIRYLRSLEVGTITPEVYAWYEGYYKNYFKKESEFYFSNAEDDFKKFDKEKINKINKKRLEIGLPLCPAVIWNTKIY